MKFGILKPFIELGWSVLLSDVDIAILQVGWGGWAGQQARGVAVGTYVTPLGLPFTSCRPLVPLPEPAWLPVLSQNPLDRRLCVPVHTYV